MGPNHRLHHGPGPPAAKAATAVASLRNGTDFHEVLDFDDAIQLTGYGRFHYRLVATCALCLLTNGLQNGLASYVFPAARCELRLAAAEIGYLNVAFLVGGVCSSFLWGAIADLVGRRRVLLGTLLASSGCTLAGALQRHYVALCACRLLGGFLTGAAGSVTFNYVSEFHAPRHRAKSVCYAGAFYTSAWLLLPALAYVVLPLPAARLGGVSAWRLFLAVVAVPECLAGVCLLFLPESPKYAVERDRDAALRILARMYAENRRRDERDFPVGRLRAAPVAAALDDDAAADVGKVRRLLAEMIAQIRRIFRRPLAHVTALLSLIMFCNMFGNFGLGLWLPELFMRFERFEARFPDAPASVQQLATLSLAKDDAASCAPEFDAALFRATLAVGATSLAGNAASGWLSGRLPLRAVPLATMAAGGLAAGVIYWLTASWQHLVAACVFQAAMATANIALGGVVVALFPTQVAGVALCLALFVGRVSGMLSNLMFGLLVDVQPAAPIFAVAAVLLLGAAFCAFIPDGVAAPHKNATLTDVIGKQGITVAVIGAEKCEKALALQA